MLKLAGMDDAALLGFLAKRHKEVYEAIAATPEFELKGEYTPELLLPVLQTITALVKVDSKAPAPIKQAATALIAKIDKLEEQPEDQLLKSLTGIQEELKKRGARNSAQDAALLQNAHDTICKLGAACAPSSPHAMDGKDVMALPPGSANKADGTTKEGDVMATAAEVAARLAKDAVSSEGNKRGAAVTSPTLPAESSNGVNNEAAPDPAAVGAEAAKAKAKPSWMDDADGDDDQTKASKAKAREMFGKTVTVSQFDLDAMINKAVAAAVRAAPAEVPVIPRVAAPALLQVGKDGTTQKAMTIKEQADVLRKSVTRHAADELGKFAGTGDDDTCTLIKAIHKNHILVPDAELQVLGLSFK
jgi:hypothetical protein